MMRLHLIAAAVAAASAAVDPYFPLYHVRPAANWINDPNGPFYDAETGLTHMFNQYNPWGAVWGNMSWSHSVSADLVHWSHLPVALYNNASYDTGGVFTGSVTVVNGEPVIAYTCVGPTGQRQCLARPALPVSADPMRVHWTKDAANPVIDALPPGNQGDFRDDTTAWYDEDSQAWVFAVGSRVFDANGTGRGAVALYASPDMSGNFTYSNNLYQWPLGSGMNECPDVVALPDSATGGVVTVVKTSHDGADYWAPGAYDPFTRTWTPSAPETLQDYGRWYASKSHSDAPSGRRILWGWVAEEDGGAVGRGWASVNSLPRAVSYDAASGALLAQPIAELAQLRSPAAPLASLGAAALPGDGSLLQLLAPAAPSAGDALPQRQVEVEAFFSLPAGVTAGGAFEFGVAVFQGGAGAASLQTRVGVSGQSALGPLNNTDEPGGDFFDFPSPFQGAPVGSADEAANVANCSAACAGDARCVAWTYVRPGDVSPQYPYAPRCSMKAAVPAPTPAACCVSGRAGGTLLLVNRTLSGSTGDTGPHAGPVALAAPGADGSVVVRLHVFVDASIVEAFTDAGSARVTSRLYVPDLSANGVALYGAPVGGAAGGGPLPQLLNASVWGLGPAYTEPEAVLAAARRHMAARAAGEEAQ